MTGGPVRRHLTIVLRDSGVLVPIEELRARWDPVMAPGVPAHVTVVYPEEITDEALLLERIAHEVPRLRSFPLDIRDVERDEDARGVFLRVTDRTGVLTALKQRLLAPPFTNLAYPFHVTIVHPRTSERSADALAALQELPLSGSVNVSELQLTETVPGRMEAVHRFALASPRVQQVAVVLRREDRVLLGHRNPNREYFPDTWDLPGGHVEPDEHAADAAGREAREELGIELGRLPALPTIARSDDALGVDLSVWVLDQWDGEPSNAAPAEHDALEWCAVDDWTTRPLAHPAYLALLDDVTREC